MKTTILALALVLALLFAGSAMAKDEHGNGGTINVSNSEIGATSIVGSFVQTGATGFGVVHGCVTTKGGVGSQGFGVNSDGNAGYFGATGPNSSVFGGANGGTTAFSHTFHYSSGH